jgi:hypothetical protein
MFFKNSFPAGIISNKHLLSKLVCWSSYKELQLIFLNVNMSEGNRMPSCRGVLVNDSTRCSWAKLRVGL